MGDVPGCQSSVLHCLERAPVAPSTVSAPASAHPPERRAGTGRALAGGRERCRRAGRCTARAARMVGGHGPPCSSREQSGAHLYSDTALTFVRLKTSWIKNRCVKKCKARSEDSGFSFGEGGCQHGSPELPLPASSSAGNPAASPSWETLPGWEGPREVEDRCSPSADPSLCLHQGRGGQAGGSRLGWGRVGTGMGSSFQRSHSCPARMAGSVKVATRGDSPLYFQFSKQPLAVFRTGYRQEDRCLWTVAPRWVLVSPY